MKSRTIATLVVALSLASALAVEAREDRQGHGQNATIDRFVQLAGEWVGKGTHGGALEDIRVNYKVTSGGSTVVETLSPGSDHEMITVIHPDGDALVLTHYCMLGNQPQMRATPKAGDNKVAFEFVKATNLKSEKDMYMRNVTYTFVDKDTLRTEWTNYNQGKEAGKAVFELKRRK